MKKKTFNFRSLTITAGVLFVAFVLGMFVTEQKSMFEDRINGEMRSKNLDIRARNLLPTFVRTHKIKALPKVSVTGGTKKVVLLNLKGENVVGLFGEVNQNAKIIADQIRAFNRSSKRPIYLIIDSPGGSVVSGANLIAAIQASKLPVYTICYNLCASMAAMIHQYGDRRLAVDRSLIMFHPASSQMRGNLDVIHSLTRTLVRYIGKIEVDVAKRIGLSYNEYKIAIVNELWVDSEDAIKLNIIDGIVDVSGVVTSSRPRLFGKKKRRSNNELLWIYEGSL